jgi:hypothetical protein
LQAKPASRYMLQGKRGDIWNFFDVLTEKCRSAQAIDLGIWQKAGPIAKTGRRNCKAAVGSPFEPNKLR